MNAQIALYEEFCRDGDNSQLAILFGNPTGRPLTSQEQIQDLKLFQDYIDVFTENVLYSIQHKHEKQPSKDKQNYLKEKWLRFHYFNSDPFTIPYKIDKSIEYAAE
jgi:hypothetical protein